MGDNSVLGQQPIKKLLPKFAVPCVLGLLVGALYNIVDQIFIGNSSLGYLGNAATGISFPVICLVNAVCWCVGDGATAYLSICSGRQDSESAHKCVGTGITTTLLISLGLTALSLIFCRPLMLLFGASSATLNLAEEYFKIIALFFPVYTLSNVMNGVIRADGSPNYAMAANLSGAFLNIILDPICIFLLDWGIKGAAIATVIGQMVSFIVSLAYLFKPKSFRLSKQSFKIDGSMLKNLISLGGSTFIIQVSMVIMTVLSNVTLAGYGELSAFGSDIPISVFSIQTKVYTIVNNIVVGIALGGQPIWGYNYGAGKMDRVRETYKLVLIYGMAVGLISTAFIEIWPEIAINVFGKQTDLYMSFAVKSFRIFLSMGFITCFIKISSIFFQAIGKPLQAMLASVIRDMFCFVIFTVALSKIFELSRPGSGIYGILFASPLSDLTAGTVVLVLTVKFFKKLKTEVRTETAPAEILASHPGTVVTIARQHGSCGKAIGEILAEKLELPFYSKELAALLAYESGMADEFFSEENADKSGILNKMYLSTKVAQQGIFAQEKLIRKIADQGACVIVGRAADYVLRRYENVVRVFIYAPEETRIKNIQQMYGDSPEDAKLNMHRSDDARAAYYRSISGKEWQDMANYDLCIDSSVGKERCAQMIADFVKAKEEL